MEKLQNDIASLQSQGALVKLAYGGEEWGNIKPTENVFNLKKSLVKNP